MTQTGVVSWSQTASSNGTADSNVNFAEGMAPSQVNDSARAAMASVAKWRDDRNGTLVSSGSSSAYTVVSNQNFSTLAFLNGNDLRIRFHTANAAAATLNVDTLGAKPININTATAVSSGMITTGAIWNLTYDNSNNIFVATAGTANVPTRTTVAGVPYTVVASDRTVAITTLTSAITVTVNSTTVPVGAYLTVVDEVGTANTNNITLNCPDGNINGSANFTINTSFGAATLVSNGSNKLTVVFSK